MYPKTDPIMIPAMKPKRTRETVITTLAAIWDAVRNLSQVDLDSLDAYQDGLSLYETTFKKTQCSTFEATVHLNVEKHNSAIESEIEFSSLAVKVRSIYLKRLNCFLIKQLFQFIDLTAFCCTLQ